MEVNTGQGQGQGGGQGQGNGNPGGGNGPGGNGPPGNPGELTFVQSERHIYGSSRLGMDVTPLELISPLEDDEDASERILRYKQYEMSNHLGNVLAVVSDVKIPVDETEDSEVDFWVSDVISATDYSPFGVRLIERNFNTSKYRYSFQNQEHDDEVSGEGNSVNYTYRMQDTRLGRFKSIDPLYEDYPWNSTYAFSENRVIDGVELEGLEYWKSEIKIGIKMNIETLRSSLYVGYDLSARSYSDALSVRKIGARLDASEDELSLKGYFSTYLENNDISPGSNQTGFTIQFKTSIDYFGKFGGLDSKISLFTSINEKGTFKTTGKVTGDTYQWDVFNSKNKFSTDVIFKLKANRQKEFNLEVGINSESTLALGVRNIKSNLNAKLKTNFRKFYFDDSTEISTEDSSMEIKTSEDSDGQTEITKTLK